MMLPMQGAEPESQESGETNASPEPILTQPELSAEEAPVSDAAMEPPFMVDHVATEKAEDVEPSAPITIESDAASDDPAEQIGDWGDIGVERPRTRLQELDDAILAYPESPTNYVLRGELRLQRDDLAGAAADFQVGIALALRQSATADWGFVYEAMIERAEAGLRRIRER